MSRPTIITCAVTGSAPLNPKYPAALEFPISPTQICSAAVEAAKAGAAVVHIHVRDPMTGGSSRDPKLFREVVDRIRQTGTDVVINLTCGLGAFFLPHPDDESRGAEGSDVASVADRIRHIEDCLPDICSLNVTTANQVDGDQDFVYLNTPRTLRAMATRFQQLGVKAELETFQAGDVLLAAQFVKEGLFSDPPLFQFVLGIKWGAPASPQSLIYMRDLLPPGAQWTAFGIARDQPRMVAQSVLLGGNVRVGLEDNLYLRQGVFATNAQLVERAARQIQDLGESVATPTETRAALGLGKPS